MLNNQPKVYLKLLQKEEFKNYQKQLLIGNKIAHIIIKVSKPLLQNNLEATRKKTENTDIDHKISKERYKSSEKKAENY